LQVTLKHRLLLHAPGLTPTAVLEKLAEIKMIDVWIPTVDQRWLILPRYTQPSPDTKLLIEKLGLELPNQPPPRLVAQKESNDRRAHGLFHECGAAKAADGCIVSFLFGQTCCALLFRFEIKM
jgi:hypothetical protein